MWDNDARNAYWYGCVIVETPSGETDYFDAYSSESEDAPDVDNLAPEGFTILERTLKLTHKGCAELGSWADEYEMIPEGETSLYQDEYAPF